LGEDALAQLELGLRRGKAKERSSVAHTEAPGPEIGLDRLGKPQESQRIRDRRAVLPESLRQDFLRPAKFAEKPLIRLGSLDRIEVLSEKILLEGKLERLGIAELSDLRRDPCEACLLSSPPPSLADDDLIPVAPRPRDDRFQDP
jgi:hypothetical protein